MWRIHVANSTGVAEKRELNDRIARIHTEHKDQNWVRYECIRLKPIEICDTIYSQTKTVKGNATGVIPPFTYPLARRHQILCS